MVVRPASVRRETLGLVLALLLIVGGMALRFSLAETDAATRYLRPYQKLDNLLTGPDRALFQSLLAAVPEIVDIRDEEGQWPEAELLEMDAIPPFDDSFLPPDQRGCVWSSSDGLTWIDYLGNTEVEGRKYAFILRIIDLHADYHPHPHPGLDYDPTMRVATQVWIYPQPDRPYPGERLPEAGWWWVVTPDDPSLSAPADDRAKPTAADAGNPNPSGETP